MENKLEQHKETRSNIKTQAEKQLATGEYLDQAEKHLDQAEGKHLQAEGKQSQKKYQAEEQLDDVRPSVEVRRTKKRE